MNGWEADTLRAVHLRSQMPLLFSGTSAPDVLWAPQTAPVPLVEAAGGSLACTSGELEVLEKVCPGGSS